MATDGARSAPTKPWLLERPGFASKVVPLPAPSGRGQLVLLRVRIVLRHSAFGRILIFSRVGIKLKPLAGCGEFKAASVRIVSGLGVPWRELEVLGVRIVLLRRGARRGHQRGEQDPQYQHERDP